jgi:hypothetical protein
MAALVRPRGYLVGGVGVPVGHALSGPKPNVTASPRGGVESNGR